MSPWWALTIPALVVLGACSIVFSTTAATRLQLATPAHLRGRVMSLYFLLFTGSTPIGGALMGALAERVGVPAAVALAACGLGVAGGLAYLRQHRADLAPKGLRPLPAAGAGTPSRD